MKLILPRNSRSGIVESAHQGHLSMETIYNYLRKYYFWPQIKSFVEANAKSCPAGREFEKSKPRQQTYMPTKLQAFEP